MFAKFSALAFALVVSGLAVAGVGAAMEQAPMQKAIDIHKEHLAVDSPMPVQSKLGQQTAIDHLMRNQERWVAAEHGPPSVERLTAVGTLLTI